MHGRCSLNVPDNTVSQQKRVEFEQSRYRLLLNPRKPGKITMEYIYTVHTIIVQPNITIFDDIVIFDIIRIITKL